MKLTVPIVDSIAKSFILDIEEVSSYSDSNSFALVKCRCYPIVSYKKEGSNAGPMNNMLS